MKLIYPERFNGPDFTLNTKIEYIFGGATGSLYEIGGIAKGIDRPYYILGKMVCSNPQHPPDLNGRHPLHIELKSHKKSRGLVPLNLFDRR